MKDTIVVSWNVRVNADWGRTKPGGVYEGFYGEIPRDCFRPVLIDRTVFGRA